MMGERDLDEAIAGWARAGALEGAGEKAALARILSHADALPHTNAPAAARRWMPFALGGGALMLSIALALLTMPAAMPPAQQQPAVQMVAIDDTELAASAAGDEVDSFALLYTLTDEEEQYL